MPWVVFIHGLGVTGEIWSDPANTRVLGGYFPLSFILREDLGKGKLKTLFHDLREVGYSVATWDQQRPAGEMETATEELELVMEKIKKEEKPEGIILAGHSRGGLIARKYLEREDPAVIGFLSMAAPHGGSSLAGWQKYVKPAARMVRPLLPAEARTGLGLSVRRLVQFIEGPAIKELLPGSGFFQDLKGPAEEDLPAISAGGTCPHLFDLMGFSFPGPLEKLAPGLIPPELRRGEGDGMVSRQSSVYPYSLEHVDFPVNHAEILFDEAARSTLANRVLAIS